MAKVDLAKTVEGIHGKIGKLLYKKLGGQQLVMAAPDYSNRPLPKQLESQKPVMRDASRAWHNLKRENPILAAAYRARATQRQVSVFSLFYADFSNGPRVEELDVSQYTGQSGQTISILAIDVFEVRKLEVHIRASGGSVIESGEAVRANPGSDWWIYTSQGPAATDPGATVEAVATNWPGKQDSRVQLLNNGSGGAPA